MAKPEVDIIDMKDYLINEYRFATKRKEQFDKNDDEVDSNYEAGKMEALWDAMSFLFGVNIHNVSTLKLQPRHSQPSPCRTTSVCTISWPV